MKPLLGIDAGELESEPEELYALADLVHLACGGHAGDEHTMTRVVQACLRLGTRVGAHPSYLDREGFGRRELAVPASLVADAVESQCRALESIARREGAVVRSVKPHGALYHAANRDPEIARACVVGARRALGAFAIVASAGGALEAAARSEGLSCLREQFADRAVRADGALVPRGEPGAMIVDPAAAAARARALAERVDVETIGVHADTEGALAIVRAVREALGPRA